MDLFDPDLEKFLHFITMMNVVLLIFNMLPIYPLDGGQILQALLWFVVGRAKSLMIVSVIGMVVGAIVCILALVGGVVWYVVLAGFVVMRSFAGFQQARALAKLLALPKHDNAACPHCDTAPLWGAYWACEQCGARFDPFVQHGICPNCSHVQAETPCPMCGLASPVEAWMYPTKPREKGDYRRKSHSPISHRSRLKRPCLPCAVRKSCSIPIWPNFTESRPRPLIKP